MEDTIKVLVVICSPKKEKIKISIVEFSILYKGTYKTTCENHTIANSS